jgi:hypothetical protein
MRAGGRGVSAISTTRPNCSNNVVQRALFVDAARRAFGVLGAVCASSCSPRCRGSYACIQPTLHGLRNLPSLHSAADVLFIRQTACSARHLSANSPTCTSALSARCAGLALPDTSPMAQRGRKQSPAWTVVTGAGWTCASSCRTLARHRCRCGSVLLACF